MAQDTELIDALALERIEFNTSVSTAAIEAEAEVKALERELAAKGKFHSGERHIRELEIRFTKITAGAIEKATAKRIELGRRIPELLTAPRLEKLRDRLHKHVDSFVKSQQTRINMGGHSYGGVSAALNQRAEIKANQLKAQITNKLAAVRLEARLGMHEQEKQVTFNISNSTIASLNLGTVVGDLTASVQTLNTQGQKEFAAAIQTLTEAIAASAEIETARRKELLEHLSVVSAESALPPEKRKLGPLRSSVAFLREGLAVAAQLAALWPPVEEMLKTMGVLPRV